MRSTLPEEYRGVSEEGLLGRIRAVKDKLGAELVILTHHYQRQSIVDVGDFQGDSYKLCVAASEQPDAKYIVFCGVNFMAESAAIICRGDQRVFHPEFSSGCPLADMADLEDVASAWKQLGEVIDTSRLIPLTYMNSSNDIKAFCGARSGAVVTSSNAPAGFKWAFERGDRVMFFPDEHLGTNTADKLKIPDDEVVVWDPSEEMGGLDAERIRKAKAILWRGHCHVHTFFTTEHVAEVRDEHPGAKIVVHPECPREVVRKADADGSTEFIINYVSEAGAGSEIAVGTEINLVSRLAAQYPDRRVFELARSLCPNMYRINLNNLCYTLENLPDVNLVEVDPATAQDALKALRRMLEIK